MKKLSVLSVVSQLFTLPVLAAPSVDIGASQVGGGDLLGFVKGTLNLAITLAGLIAVAYLVYSGITYIVAAGDESKIEKATKGITYAVIGLIICFISVLIVNFILEQVLV